MKNLNILIILVVVMAAQLISAGLLPRARRANSKTDEAKTDFERMALNETKAFLNGMFKSQIDYFGKVKADLPANTKRGQDIEKYIARLEKAIEAENIDEKDRMWRDTFNEFSESAFLLNEKADTGMSNDEYKRILDNNGLEQVTKNFLIDVASYFWKMAKASGKVVEMTIDEHLDKLRN